jgi:hypothetical protein
VIKRNAEGRRSRARLLVRQTDADLTQHEEGPARHQDEAIVQLRLSLSNARIPKRAVKTNGFAINQKHHGLGLRLDQDVAT